MKKNTIFTVILTGFLCFASSLSVFSQHSTFFKADDDRQRGYFDRPYLRYEAEPGLVNAYQGTFLAPTFDQRTIQSEASNQQALDLVNVGDFVQWENSEAADGMTIRFSIPDGITGGGTTGTLKLYVNGEPWNYIKNSAGELSNEIELNSFWAWQYFNMGVSSYPDNTPGGNRFPRMRFDEKRVKLDEKIPEGAIFKLVKVDEGAGAYTIDFVELEPIPAKVEKPEGAIEYTGDGSDLVAFVTNMNNQGKTIYIPEGKYDIPVRLYIHGNGTKLIGAGMWYTQLHFTASSNSTINNPKEPTGYNARGFESGASNVEVRGFYITTENDRRYATYYSNSLQVGKGFNGSFGTNSNISDVWVTHFECGAWIEGTDGLHISHSRFRNNYADGINLSRDSKNSIVEHCSFRNNGDDDMASWSRDNQATENNTFQYSISENCWRAAGIGFFGGKQNKALNCVIIDPIECGIRANNDFDGAPFSSDGYFEIRNISIYRAGNKPGTRGQSGDLWGQRTAAIFINSSYSRYDVRNIAFTNVDVYNSKGDAIYVRSGSREIINVILENVTVKTVSVSDIGNAGSYYGLRFDNARGSSNLFCINFENIAEDLKMNQSPPAGFTVTSTCNASTRIIRVNETLDLKPLIPENFSNNAVFTVISGENIISVDAQGIVTAREEGTAQVGIADAENTYTFTIIVKDIAVTGISLSEETLMLCVRDTSTLTAAIKPANATNQTYTWTTSDRSIATVSAYGRVTARAAGEVIITVTTEDGKYTATCTVTIACVDIITPDAAPQLTIAAYGNTIHISGQTDGETISIYNLLGSKVYSQQLTEGTKIIRGLREGIYIVTAEKAQVTQKVIITK